MLENVLNLLGIPHGGQEAGGIRVLRDSKAEVGFSMAAETPSAKDLFESICERVSDIEVIKAYRNLRVSGRATDKPDPPKTTTVSGEKYTTEMMSSGLRRAFSFTKP